MRKIYSIFILTVVLVSCSTKQESSLDQVLASNNIKALQAKKDSLDLQQQILIAQINQINRKLESLNPDRKIPLITTFLMEEQVFTHYLELQGNVKTKQNVLIYPEMPGLLKRVLVEKGDKVVKGQLLAIIDNGGAQEQLAQVEATAQLAKTTYERQKRLWDQKIGSEIQFLQSRTDYLAKKNAVDQLTKQLGKYNITAPFSGVIDDVIKEEGTIVAPGSGSEVFRIVNLNNMYIETDVPETYIKDVVQGKHVKIDFPVLGESIHSKIRQAGNFINPSNRTFKVEVSIPKGNKHIKPNLTARLKINDYSNDKAMLIPLGIISENAAGKQYVYVIEDRTERANSMYGKAVQRMITVGKTQGDKIEVLTGITTGDELVLAGARRIKDKQEVKIDIQNKQ